MRRSLLSLLLALTLGVWGVVGTGICAQPNHPLKLVPDPQQAQSHPGPQGVSSAPDALHDIRGPVLLPESAGMLFWFVGGLALLIIAGLIFFFWKRRKKGRHQLRPHEIALADLAGLRPMMNPEQALIYAAQLSEILRRYIEVRFLIHSTRQTTQEFFSALTKSLHSATPRGGLMPAEPGPESRLHLAYLAGAASIMEQHRDQLHECLDTCDLAKFAHCVPDQQDMEAMEQAVRSFIEATAQAIDEKGA